MRQIGELEPIMKCMSCPRRVAWRMSVQGGGLPGAVAITQVQCDMCQAIYSCPYCFALFYNSFVVALHSLDECHLKDETVAGTILRWDAVRIRLDV